MSWINTSLMKISLPLIVALIAGSSGLAQFETPGIPVTASAESKGKAERMRVSVTIEAKGADLKTAMASMVEKKKKATIKLEKLEAIEESIVFGEIGTGGQSDTSSMIRQMQRSFGDDPRVAKMMKVKPPITLKVTLTADWNVDGEPEELMIACDELKQKVTETDLGGNEEEEELSEEQAELAEEMAEMMSNFGGGDETPTGTPNFYYIRVITPEVHDQLVAQAFAKAKSKAERLAKATSQELGGIRMLVLRESEVEAYASYGYGYPYGGNSATPQPKTLDDGSIEAVSTSPTNVSHSATIAVAYEIK